MSRDNRAELSENEKALQDFLLDIKCLDDLLPWTGKFNMFDVLKISRTEIRHSNLLAWLMNPNETHGLGDGFIKGLMQRIVENDSEGKYDVFHVLLLDFHSFTVYREWKNIDILLVSDKESTVIAFENKVSSHEHDNQLNRYKRALEKMYPEYKPIYVYLTPDGEPASDEENWTSLSYDDVLDILETIIKHDELLPDVEMMIKHYIEVIRRDIVDDQQLKEVCNKIYAKHKRALDLLFEHRIDSRGQLVEIIRSTLEELESSGKILYDAESNDSFIIFHTEAMNRLLPALPPHESKKGSWRNFNSYLYWIGRRDLSFHIVFELGGWDIPDGEMETMQKIIDIEKPADKKRSNFRYKRIYSKIYNIDDSDDFEINARNQVIAAVEDILRWERHLIERLSAGNEGKSAVNT